MGMAYDPGRACQLPWRGSKAHRAQSLRSHKMLGMQPPAGLKAHRDKKHKGSPESWRSSWRTGRGQNGVLEPVQEAGDRLML